jgi:Uma2 family endonuclease
MPNIDRVAKDIETTEGFAVRIRAKNPQTKHSYQKYSYERIARGSFTVADWRRRRFESAYPDFAVEVLFGDGRPASSRATLSKIRTSYN